MSLTALFRLLSRYWGPEYRQSLKSGTHVKRQGTRNFRSVRIAVKPAGKVLSATLNRTASIEQAGPETQSEQHINPPWSDCLTIIQQPELSALFEAHVNKALCADSYKFLQDALAYRDVVYSSVAEQVMSAGSVHCSLLDRSSFFCVLTCVEKHTLGLAPRLRSPFSDT